MITLLGISPRTTLFAPITTPLPIHAPGNIVTFSPIHTRSPIYTGADSRGLDEGIIVGELWISDLEKYHDYDH